MRLDPLCDAILQYEGEGVWLKPYGEAEAAGFGAGVGSMKGTRLSGKLAWANHPRRREDGVWCPDVHGSIATADGAQLLFEMRGYSVLEKAKREMRAITAVFLFQASDPRYKWLYTTVAPAEGEIDEEAGRVTLRVFACVNEAAPGPPAAD